ncbi:MAG: aconitase X [Nitrososphaeria archaeon]
MSYARDVSEKILRALSKYYNESRLLKISSAHLSGVSYDNIGDEGLSFLRDMSRDGKFAVYTTVNPMGADIYDNVFSIDEYFISRQREIAESLLKMGALESFTCTPFEYFNIPPSCSHVSWAESSAVVYANSFLNILTNKESALSALSSAILGKTIYSGLHHEYNRIPSRNFKIGRFADEIEAGLYAYQIAKLVEEPFSITLEDRMTSLMKKSFSSALGATGNVSFFKINMSAPISYKIGFDDIKREFVELSTEESGEMIILGCPHWNHNEIISFVSMLGQKCLKKDCLIACYKGAYQKVLEHFEAKILNKKRIFFFKGACPIFSPLLRKLGVRTIITNSVKAAHYYKLRGIKVSLKNLKEIIEVEAE